MIDSRTTVNFSYRSFNSREPKEFILFPHLLKEYKNRWFIFGSRAGDMKIFNLALDRIIDFHPCPEIPYQDNPDFTEDYFANMIGVTKHERLETATIRFLAENSIASYILTKPIHSSQRLISRNESDGSMTFEIADIIINPELEKEFLSHGAGVKVLTPKSLAKKLKKTFRKAAELYSDPKTLSSDSKIKD